MKAIIGTAGHIDHGKSALVFALTGIDPDRLAEEKRRGISIELGFAYLATSAGDRIGIVDVPGHERFVRQMLAGAQGFDYVLVVVAADDGVMPQTEEHLEICHLLGLRNGAVVITKSDLASPERIEEVRGEIALLVERTPFETAPVFVASAATGDGIDELRSHLVEAAARVERKSTTEEPFRLPIDRVFVRRGQGVVVTGTAAAGSIGTGEEVVVAPGAGGRRVRVREIQVHGRATDRAWAGQRIAINITGLEHTAIARGKTMLAPWLDAETMRFDARVEVRPSARRPVRSHERVRIHLGTAEVLARLVWLGEVQQVVPERSALAQIVLLRESLVALAGDRFVLRDETGVRTIGGGRVLFARAGRHPRLDAAVLDALTRLDADSPVERMDGYLRLHAQLGASLEEISLGVRAPISGVLHLARQTPSFVFLTDDETSPRIAARSRYDAYVAALVARVEKFHRETPSLPGIEIERLRRESKPELDMKEFRGLVDRLCREKLVERRGGFLALIGHVLTMPAEDEALANAVLAGLRTSGAMPPAIGDLQREHRAPAAKIQEVLAVLVQRGLVVKVSADLYFSEEAVSEIGSRLRNYLEVGQSITAGGFRDLIAASRKYSIPLLDYFDRSGLTVRTGDFRRLR